jgi:cytochrome b6-f complex iron-sulfur subunit
MTEGIKRRGFLDFIIGGSLIVAMGGVVNTLFKYFKPPKELIGGGSSANEVVLPLSEVSIGEAKKIKFKGEPFIIIRKATAIFALSAVCTHLGCLVNWEKDSGEIVCPCHGAKFDLNGNVKGGPAPRPLKTASAKIINDKIIIGGA